MTKKGRPISFSRIKATDKALQHLIIPSCVTSSRIKNMKLTQLPLLSAVVGLVVLLPAALATPQYGKPDPSPTPCCNALCKCIQNIIQLVTELANPKCRLALPRRCRLSLVLVLPAAQVNVSDVVDLSGTQRD